MIKDTSGPAFPADIPRINTVTPVASLSPAPVTLDAIRKIVREEIRANAALEAAARQALERLRKYHHGHGFAEDAECIAALEAALTQEQPVKVPHRHEWFSTDGMGPGQCRCIHCGAWGRSTATLIDPRGSLGEPVV